MIGRPNGSLLCRIIAEYLAGEIDIALFCRNFETEFNFGERTEFDRVHFNDLKSIFAIVVMRCPFQDELALYPGYKSAAEIDAGVRKIATELGL